MGLTERSFAGLSHAKKDFKQAVYFDTGRHKVKEHWIAKRSFKPIEFGDFFSYIPAIE